MASAGRILIMPKGNYDSGVTYEMLDLVFNGGASWVAKKTVVGIEPNEENTEHWMKMCDSVDLTEVNRRLTELENRAVVDLTPYALKTEVEAVSGEVDALEEIVAGLTQTISGLSLSLAEVEENANQPTSKIAVVSYNGTGTSGNPSTPNRVTFDFAPKVIMLLGNSGQVFYSGNYYERHTSSTGNLNNEKTIFCDLLTTNYLPHAGFFVNYSEENKMRYARKSADGKTIEWYIAGGDSISQCNAQNYTYYVLGIG